MTQSVGAGLPDFITVATAADGKLMTKIFYVDRDGKEQTRGPTLESAGQRNGDD